MTEIESQTGPVKAAIAAKLRAEFDPQSLEVIDESAMHAGHAGAPEGGESHFRVKIVSDRFAGMNRIERHRAVNAVLAEEFAAGLHALAVKASAPGEGAG